MSYKQINIHIFLSCWKGIYRVFLEQQRDKPYLIGTILINGDTA